LVERALVSRPHEGVSSGGVLVGIDRAPS